MQPFLVFSVSEAIKTRLGTLKTEAYDDLAWIECPLCGSRMIRRVVWTLHRLWRAELMVQASFESALIILRWILPEICR